MPKKKSSQRSSTTSQSSYDALLSDTFASLSLEGAGPSNANRSRGSTFGSSDGTTRSSGSTYPLWTSGVISVANSTDGGLSSSASSSNGSSETSSSGVLVDFLSDSGSFESSFSSYSDKKAAKLLLWQAILVAVGLCQGYEGEAIDGVVKPAHFPDELLPLPTTLTQCKKLIEEYVFLNIVNFKKSQLGNEKLRLFSSANALKKYTLKHHRFAKLNKAKKDFLQPLLRTLFFKNRLTVVYEEDED